jgi:NAD+ kinase
MMAAAAPALRGLWRGRGLTERRIAFVAAATSEAAKARERLADKYSSVEPERADVIVALGGDGHMLETLHQHLDRPVAIYGMNCGTVGFLMNQYGEENLPERLAKALSMKPKLLRMEAHTVAGKTQSATAFNEVALLRETRQAAKIAIRIDGKVRLPELICDGILLSTPAGSTAYNLSAHGPILPLGSNLLALTPISAFRPRRWRGALLPETAAVEFEILEAAKRPVSAVADFTEVRDVASVRITADRARALTMLFDPEHNLEERILSEQFGS